MKKAFKEAMYWLTMCVLVKVCIHEVRENANVFGYPCKRYVICRDCIEATDKT